MTPQKELLNRVYGAGGCSPYRPCEWTEGWDTAISYCVSLIMNVLGLDHDDILDKKSVLNCSDVRKKFVDKTLPLF